MSQIITEEMRQSFLEKQIIRDGSFMNGSYFMPSSGKCYSCGADLIEHQINIEGNDGSNLVTGCHSCFRSYCE